jgi:hypothetical protein
MDVVVVKKGVGTFKNAWLVKRGKKYFVIDRAFTFDHGDETMVFRSDKNGNVRSYRDIYVRYNCSHEDMITTMESDYD